MIVELAGAPANEAPPVSPSPSFAVDPGLLPIVLIVGAVFGVWLVFKVIELVRRLFIPLAVAGMVILVGQQLDWPVLDGLWPFGTASATDHSTDIPPLKDLLPPR